MESETLFRLMFAAILVTAFVMSGTFRRRARRSSAIARRSEGGRMMFLRLLVAAPFFLGMVVYVIRPAWMAWAALSLPAAVRWGAVVVGLAMLPVLYWVLRSIGRNISETVLTKTDHELVTHGPYRWVRHPLYTSATVVFLALGVIAANGFILLMALVAFAGVAFFIIPKEEAQLTEKFGGAYVGYKQRTGALVPRLIPRG